VDELAKIEARNYLSAAGFFLIGIFWLIMIFTNTSGDSSAFPSSYLYITLGIGLLAAATLLVVLHKRDMIALLFFIFGFWQLFCGILSIGPWTYVIAGFMLLVALVILTGKDKQKWVLFLIPVIYFLLCLYYAIFNYNVVVVTIFHIILAVLPLYFAFCCASERLHLPGSKFFTSDQQTDFKSSGSVLGYLLFALMLGGYALYYFSGGTIYTIESARMVKLLAACLMVFIAILLLAVGKMRFTPIMFMLLGLCCIAEYCISDTAMFYGMGIAECILGIFAILRKESRILPGIMIIFFSSTCFLSLVSVSSSPGYMLASAILNLIPCMIAIYLAFVVYSQKKLPKF